MYRLPSEPLVRHHPAAKLEAAARVFLRPPRGLHDPIQRNERVDGQLGHDLHSFVAERSEQECPVERRLSIGDE